MIAGWRMDGAMGETRKILTAEQRALITAPIDRARTLPREAFFSPAFFEAEIERIYARRWVGVLFEFEIADPIPGSVNCCRKRHFPDARIPPDRHLADSPGNRNPSKASRFAPPQLSG